MTIQRIDPDRALIWLPLESQFDVAGVRSVRNLGKATGAPQYAILGDGATATTFPSQVQPRGVMFANATQRVNTTLVDPFTISSPHTYYALLRYCPTPITTYSPVFDNYSASTGMASFLRPDTFGLAVSYYGVAGSWEMRVPTYLSAAGLLGSKRTLSVAWTYDGLGSIDGVTIYRNGVPVTKTVTSNNIVGGFAPSGFPVYFGYRPGGSLGYGSTPSGVLCATAYPYRLTPQEMASLDLYARREAKVA